MGSLVLSAERVCLWATVARHLWGAQVTGLAAKRTGYMCEWMGSRRKSCFWGVDMERGSVKKEAKGP